jgi:uncharacterized protein DUF1264
MKNIMIISVIVLYLASCSLLSPTFPNAGHSHEHDHEHGENGSSVDNKPKLYNETFNPRQKEYPNHIGFNDLHIQAIRHIRPEGKSEAELSKLDVIVHHHCKAYDDGTLTCLMFHSGMKDQDKPIGFEYIITAAQYTELSENEKKFWHYHKTEIPRAKAALPDLMADEAAKLLPAINETYGKVVYFWKMGDKYPVGEPFVLKIHELPDRN